MEAIINRKARFNYEVLETYTAGISLVGNEVKSIRQGQITITESFCTVDDGEVFLRNCNITNYKGTNNLDIVSPNRDRRLLLTKREIRKISKDVQQKGNTIIPLKVYFNENGYVKVEIGICRGKKNYDKRETIKERDLERYGD